MANIKLIAKNPNAYHNYEIKESNKSKSYFDLYPNSFQKSKSFDKICGNIEIVEKIEAGLVLTGTEIKSIRLGKVNLKDSFATIKNGECFVIGMHISPYEFGNIYNKDPLRDRKLLLNRSEINKLIGKIKTKGYSLVPISIYFKGSLVKLELGIGKGKKIYDKRQDIAKKDAERRIAIALKGNY